MVDYYTLDLTRTLVGDLKRDPSVDEVIVVDNTGDESYDIEIAGTRLVTAPVRGGFGHGVNRGVAATDATHIMVLNSDLRIRRGQLATLADVLDTDDRTAWVSPLILDAGGMPQRDAAGAMPKPWTRSHEFVRGETAPWRTGAAFMMTRADFEEIGGFDERYFMYWEDVDLCARLALAGRDVVAHDEVVFTHTSGASESSSSRRYRYAAASRSAFLAKWHYPPWQRWTYDAVAAAKALHLRRTDR